MMRQTADFMPPIGLANPHVQTILSSMGRKVWQPRHLSAFDQSATVRIIEVNGVKLAAELNLLNKRPLVIIIPGWLGSARSSYVISAARALSGAGFSVARLNLRDHGGTAHLNPGLFNSALIDEVVAGVQFLTAQFSHRGSGLLGFSLGGNFTLRVARELPDLPALAVCPALEPDITMHRIDRNPIYQRYFVHKWRKTWLEKQQAFPHLYDFSHSRSLSTISALTDYFVRYHSGFDTTQSYFSTYDLSHNALAGVHAHILAAADDPIIPVSQYRRLPGHLTLNMTKRGGHGAFLETWGLRSWADNYALQYFEQILGKQDSA